LNEYHENLYQIGIISNLTAADFASLSSVGFQRFVNDCECEPESILDVGCGAGWLAIALAGRFRACKITGIEISEEAIHYAKMQQQTILDAKIHQNILFRKVDHVDLREPDNSVDIVTCSLVTHHIPTDEDIVTFLKRAGQVAKKAVIINDLERDPIAIFAYQIFIKPLFSNRLTRHDGLLSIRRSFSKFEWHSYLLQAGYSENQFRINWCPISRFIIYIDVRNKAI
jgi:2-polyprenyl-3-methyl-5-hydroxy-6-metoxy-1,4-benzoquinol methylase